jgi:release factor glutamine methyltransferase
VKARMSLSNPADIFAACVERLARGMRALPDKPDETPYSTARALWQFACGRAMSPASAIEFPLPLLNAKASLRLDELVTQRLAGVPLAYLTGTERFMGLDLLCTKEAMIPRRETELLGHAALEALRKRVEVCPTVTVLDVCTGSGNLAVAMAHYVPGARVFAADSSAGAVALARRNVAARRLDARIEVRAGDLLAPFDTPEFHDGVDLLLCNPPYISSGKVEALPAEIASHEPRTAFDGGPFGATVLLRLIREAPRFLRPGAVLGFEVGRGQGPPMLERLRKSGAYAVLRPVVDEEDHIRAVLATTEEP